MVIHKLTTTAAYLEPGSSCIPSEFAHQSTKMVVVDQTGGVVFSFSHVYGSSTSQLELYKHTTKNMMSKFISGQNCLLFTYGATNSGKTYTVQGGSGSEQGLLPRMLASLFRSIGDVLYPHRDLRPQHHCDLISLSPKETKVEEDKREALLRPANGACLSRSNEMLTFCKKVKQSCQRCICWIRATHFFMNGRIN
ncbi:Kinesin motor domain [Trinorchestia longiramus]|nr:Kinesin motor domain [Trinorchestia longiramus]